MLSRLMALAFLLLLSVPARPGVKETIATLAPSGTVLVMDAGGAELVAQKPMSRSSRPLSPRS